MPRTEDGEYELLLGNKQLLSVVFILFVLFGVFFSLGYFVGRNSNPEAAQAQPAGTQAASGGVQQPREAPPTTGVTDPNLAPGEAKVGGAEGAATAPAATGATETKPAETQPAAETPAPPAEPPAAAAIPGEPQRGQIFLQVAAVAKSEAQVIVDVLKRKGFPAMIAPVEVNGVRNEALYRALVGPLKDRAALVKTKAELEAAGFSNAIKREY